ncbi:MAG: hydrogenase iron-sulfur subunit [Acidimicrobiia bacterium]|nr:hydrogenase iron-sulfur subunit [Acidimicrobiia bacterium]
MSGDLAALKAKAILVFSTNGISDPGIDLAGSAHMHYPTAVQTIPLPCSSGIRPAWIVHALESGFAGVFVAACGTDCPYLSDCTERTGKVVAKAQEILRERGLEPGRLKMAAICSVCAEQFVSHMESFEKELARLDAS